MPFGFGKKKPAQPAWDPPPEPDEAKIKDYARKHAERWEDPKIRARMEAFAETQARSVMAAMSMSIASQLVATYVSGLDDRTCDYCRDMHHKTAPLNDAEVPPFHACTSKMGCRCTLSYKRTKPG